MFCVCMCWCRNRCCSIVSCTCMKPPKQGWTWKIAISFIEGTKYVSFVFNYMDVTSLEHWSLTYTRFLIDFLDVAWLCFRLFQISWVLELEPCFIMFQIHWKSDSTHAFGSRPPFWDLPNMATLENGKTIKWCFSLLYTSNHLYGTEWVYILFSIYIYIYVYIILPYMFICLYILYIYIYIWMICGPIIYNIYI